MLIFHYRIHWNDTETSMASKRQVAAAKKKHSAAAGKAAQWIYIRSRLSYLEFQQSDSSEQ